VLDFTITGAFQHGLINAAGDTPLFSAGDPFVITGSFDTTLQPVVETQGGSETLADMALFGTSIDYHQTALAGSTIPLAAINQEYPSEPGFADTDYKNGVFMTESIFANPLTGEVASTTHVLSLFDDFTELNLKRTVLADGTIDVSGFIHYHFHDVTTGTPPFTVVQRKNDTVDLTVTSFDMTPVPEPAGMVLVGSVLVVVVGRRVVRR